MIPQIFRRWGLALFCLYLAVFPGSTLTVALDRVPEWGEWMGGALLLLQGTIVVCWLIARFGRRGALAATLVFLMAWGVEHLGVVAGVPFGRYRYTAALQPKLLGVVPLAIPCAWLMVSLGAWQLATADGRRPTTDDRRKSVKLDGQWSVVSGRWSSVGAATLVLLLDMQIEPVATAVNRYWVWLDGGIYYGVPLANFVAWWLVGLAMAAVISGVLGGENQEQGCREPRTENQEPRTENKQQGFRPYATRDMRYGTRSMDHVLRVTFFWIPAGLYLLNTLMFTAINGARGYAMAGLVGLAALLAALAAGAAARAAIARPYPRDTGAA